MSEEQMRKPSENSRMVYIEILRIMACFFVIANHTNYVFENVVANPVGSSWGNLIGSTLYLAICKCAVTIFLMISGCLLLPRTDSYKKSLIRVLRIVLVMMVFSIPYYVIGDFEHSLYNFYLVVGRAQVTTAYWYLYLYLGVLVMMPVLQRMFSQFKKEDYCYFFLFSLFLCTFSFFTEFNVNFKLPIFVTYIGIVVLGHYLNQYVNGRKQWILPLIACIGGLLTILTAYTIYRILVGSDYAPALLHYDNIFYIAIAASVFLLAKICSLQRAGGLGARANAVIVHVGKDTFGIYLVSDFIIHYVRPFFERWNNVLAVIVLDVTVFVIGLIVTEIMKQIPLLKKLL